MVHEVKAVDPRHFARKAVTAGRAIRRWAAGFWLNLLFFCARHVPWVLPLVKGFFLCWAWNCSRQLRANTRINARWLLPQGSTSGQRNALGKRIVGSFMDFIYDVGRTSRMTPHQLREQIASIEGKEAYQQARRSCKGAIIATAHMGSFEVGMCAMRQIEKDVHVVFQRDSFSLFEKLRSTFRKRMGIHEAAIDDGWSMWLNLRDALARDEVVAIQADRVMPGQKGIRVPLLGGHALFPDGPAKLAAITGAPIIPVFTVRQPDGRVKVYIEQAIMPAGTDPEAIGEAVRQLAAVIGKYIQAYPEQWLMLHRTWCEDQDVQQTAMEDRQ